MAGVTADTRAPGEHMPRQEHSFSFGSEKGWRLPSFIPGNPSVGNWLLPSPTPVPQGFLWAAFQLTDSPFSLDFKNSFLSKYRRSQQPHHHGSYGMYLDRGKKLKQSGYAILNWFGQSMAGILVLAFVCVRYDTFVIWAAATATLAAEAQALQWLLSLLYISWPKHSLSKGLGSLALKPVPKSNTWHPRKWRWLFLPC